MNRAYTQREHRCMGQNVMYAESIENTCRKNITHHKGLTKLAELSL